MKARQRSIWGYFFISPWIVGFGALTLGPMIWSLYLSCCSYDGAAMRFIGGENYARLLHRDPNFWTAVINTCFYAALAVPLGLSGSLLLAVLLNQRIAAKGIFRTLFYLPTLVPAVASSFLWKYVFNPRFGILNAGLAKVHIQGPDWLQNTHTALPAMVIMSLWGIGGGRMIVFLAGLQGVPASLYESASLDGAGRLRQFWHVTVPMVTPMIFFNAVLGIVGAFQIFTQAFLMTQGGPNNATLFYALYLFRQAFRQLHMGYASALGWVLFLILAVLTAIQFLLARRWVHYEGNTP